MLASFLAPEWLVKPMTAVLEWFYGLTGNYGWAIIALTLVVRVVILPLTVYQMKSMKRMQEVQPLMKEIQEKYKDQPEKMNQEMMQLYRDQKVNPFSGCLPLLIQMPFLYAIFAVLNAIHLSDAMFLGMNLDKPFLGLGILTILSMFAQSWLSGAGNDPNQKMMTYMMPLVFGFITFNMKSGIVLYWVVSTIFGIVQQAIYPGFPKLKRSTGTKGEAGA
ncbi:MAG TPA: YidC/Oxa1 family membrane protein insertase [Symbiobacteriaceae bacterium]|nr:YidC/Oxa1 family membrane protein insertase [Symbiobacteriaceae bacterium]